MLKDEYEQAALAGFQLARELADVKGLGGYAREAASVGHRRRREETAEVAIRMEEYVACAAKTWRRGRYKHVEDQPLPWLWPTKVVAKAAKIIGWRKGAASLRSLVEGSWPLQFKLWAEHRAANNLCRCKQQAGTLWHKLSGCVLTENLRARECPPELSKAGKASAWDPLYSRGLPARPKGPAVPKELVWHEVAEESVEHVANGEAYTDGSSKEATGGSQGRDGPLWLSTAMEGGGGPRRAR